MKIKKIISTLAFSLVLLLNAIIVNAGSLTDYGENKLVDLMFRGQAFSETTPASWYVVLYTSACSDSSPGTEVSAAGYSRQAVTRGLTGWTGTHGTTTGVSSGTNGTVGNATAVTFSPATADWGTVTYWGLADVATLNSGNYIVCAALTSPRNITNGATASFGIGSLTFQIDN